MLLGVEYTCLRRKNHSLTIPIAIRANAIFFIHNCSSSKAPCLLEAEQVLISRRPDVLLGWHMGTILPWERIVLVLDILGPPMS